MASLTLLFLEIIMPTPKPELWAETNFPLAPWKNLTLWCRSPSGSTKEFVLLKDGTGWIATRPASEQVRAAFPLGALTQSHTGSYHCHSWEEMAVSEPSEALELVGTGKKRQGSSGGDPQASWDSSIAPRGGGMLRAPEPKGLLLPAGWGGGGGHCDGGGEDGEEEPKASPGWISILPTE